ncbi:hypothetical protein G6F22_015223 [Rhizopus arrhizus]|nr:hypothetical protein G6F22_015223 [Rhizopus arrhizus]
MIQVGGIAAAREDRQRDLRRERPGALAAVEQVGQVGAGRSEQAGQRNAGKERRPRGTDAGVARLQLMLGRQDVGPALQQFRGRARRDFLQQHGGSRQLLRQVGSQVVHAHQQRQRVAGLPHFAVHALEFRPCLLGQAQRLLVIQRRGRAGLAPLDDQFQRRFAAGQRLARDQQAALRTVARQIGLDHFGHQADPRAVRGFLGCQVFLQRGVRQAAHATEQIDLERGQPDSRLVGALHPGAAGTAQVARHPLARARALGVDARQAVRAFDPVLRPRRFDVQHGLAQVAVVLKRQRHHVAAADGAAGAAG